MIEYDRNRAVDYAQKYALTRNLNYYNFDNLGGDCTNFISQCLYYANGVDNSYIEPYWYYFSQQSRSASWTSVEDFFLFITTNKNLAPFGRLCSFQELEIGDVIQLKFASNFLFGHSLIVSSILKPTNSLMDILVCAHTTDCKNKPLGMYVFEKIRYIKIEGVYVLDN